jgi:Protein of unknown function (DUF4197)
MKISQFLLSLSAGSILILASGCGKNEVAPTPPTPAAPAAPDKPAKVELAPPVKTADIVAQATNAAVDAAAKTEINTVPAAASPAKPVPPSTTATPAQSTSTTDKLTGLLGQSSGSSAAGLAGLSQDQMITGLKDALGNGLQKAVAGLGHSDGFLTNLNVKIPMPDKLQKVESLLRTMKQDKLADDFVVTMNRAAEQAVPAAASVFVDALKQMKVEDAKAILSGPDDAATQFFRRTTQTNLYARFYPIVQQATAKTGVTSTYKQIVDKASVTQSLGSFGNALGGSGFDKNSLDIDDYVTTKALDGLFKMVADEEKKIRQNPVARTTDALQKVFGALKN